MFSSARRKGALLGFSSKKSIYLLQLPFQRWIAWAFDEISMASQNTAQYVRLRNLRSNTDLPTKNGTQDAGLRLQNRNRKLAFMLRRLSLKGLVLFFSLALNLIVILRLLTLNSVKDRALTYCEPPLPPVFSLPKMINCWSLNTAPASTAVKSERVVFSSAFGIERSLFQGNLPTTMTNFGQSFMIVGKPPHFTIWSRTKYYLSWNHENKRRWSETDG